MVETRSIHHMKAKVDIFLRKKIGCVAALVSYPLFLNKLVLGLV